MPTTAVRPTPPAVLRPTRIVVRVDAELHGRLTWMAHAHGYLDLEEFLEELLVEKASEIRTCPTCRRVARGGRPGTQAR
jgi:hypothetical protein